MLTPSQLSYRKCSHSVKPNSKTLRTRTIVKSKIRILIFYIMRLENSILSNRAKILGIMTILSRPACVGVCVYPHLSLSLCVIRASIYVTHMPLGVCVSFVCVCTLSCSWCAKGLPSCSWRCSTSREHITHLSFHFMALMLHSFYQLLHNYVWKKNERDSS